MFFNPRLVKDLTNEKFAITSATEVVIPECAAVNYIKSAVAKKLVTCGCGATAVKKLTFAVGIPESVKAEVEKDRAVSGDREEYVVIVGEETVVYAKEEQGLLYGLSTLIHLTEGGEMNGKLIYDYPVCGVRGYPFFRLVSVKFVHKGLCGLFSLKVCLFLFGQFSFELVCPFLSCFLLLCRIGTSVVDCGLLLGSKFLKFLDLGLCLFKLFFDSLGFFCHVSSPANFVGRFLYRHAVIELLCCLRFIGVLSPCIESD